MNLNELWSGTDYAYFYYKGRNDHFRVNAPRVRIIRTFKELASSENKKMTGYAEVLMLTDEGEPKLDSHGNHITRKVRARDIAMRWEEYDELRAHEQAKEERRRKEYEERQRKWEEERRVAREKAEKEAQERKLREEASRAKIKELFLTRGFPENAISSIDGAFVVLRRKELEEAFGIVEK